MGAYTLLPREGHGKLICRLRHTKNSWCIHHHHVVPPIEAGRGKVVIEIIGFVAGKAVEMVFSPFPYISVRVVKSHGVGWKHVDRLSIGEGGREGGMEGGREEGRKGGRKGRRERGREGGRERGDGGERREYQPNWYKTGTVCTWLARSILIVYAVHVTAYGF